MGNANYGWIQHFVHHLAPPNGKGGGVAGFVMANGSLSSNSGGEGEIRRRIVEADQLADALSTYTQAGGRGEAVKNVQGEAVPAMKGAFEKLRAFFHDFKYERALNTAPTSVLKLYVDAVDHVFAQEDGWKRFRTMVKELSVAFALVVPHAEAEAITPHLAFFQRVQAMIRKPCENC